MTNLILLLQCPSCIDDPRCPDCVGVCLSAAVLMPVIIFAIYVYYKERGRK